MIIAFIFYVVLLIITSLIWVPIGLALGSPWYGFWIFTAGFWFIVWRIAE